MVRIVAAWALIRQDAHRDAALACWRELIEEESHAGIMLFNCLRWAGEDARPLLPAIRTALDDEALGRYETLLAEDLVGTLANAQE